MKPTMAKLVAKLTAAREADNDSARVDKLLVRVAKRAKIEHRQAAEDAAGATGRKMGTLLAKLKAARKQSDSARVDALLVRVAKRAKREGRNLSPAGGTLTGMALNMELVAAQEHAAEARRCFEVERRRAEAQLEKELRGLQTAEQRLQDVERRLLQHHRQGHVGITGHAAVEQVFYFLDGPADVLRAATACRCWRELACADSVWRARFKRENLLDKARAFEVALPAVPNGEGGAAAERDEAAGVGLAFYARIFALKVVQSVLST